MGPKISTFLTKAGRMEYPYFNLVLFQPEIPQNTGNIGRIAVNAKCRLHIIKPACFSFEDKYLKRAGMDYWKHVDCIMHESWEDFLAYVRDAPVYFFSTKGKKSYWDCPMEPGAYLIFGRESAGLPDYIHQNFGEHFYTIPMPGQFHRSLNLANSVAIAAYEGLRKHRLEIEGE